MTPHHPMHWVSLVGRDGNLVSILPVDAADRRPDDLVGTPFGGTAFSDADRDNLMTAYGDALVTGGRVGCLYRSTAFGGTRLRVELLRFPPAEVAAIALSSEVPEEEKAPLTPRELGIVRFAADDFSDDETAAELKIAKATVSRHKQNIRAKLGVRHWPAVIAVATRRGWI